MEKNQEPKLSSSRVLTNGYFALENNGYFLGNDLGTKSAVAMNFAAYSLVGLARTEIVKY